MISNKNMTWVKYNHSVYYLDVHKSANFAEINREENSFDELLWNKHENWFMVFECGNCFHEIVGS